MALIQRRKLSSSRLTRTAIGRFGDNELLDLYDLAVSFEGDGEIAEPRPKSIRREILSRMKCTK